MLTRRGFLAAPLALAQAPAKQLNFVVILVDDWGASDAGCYGSSYYKTPNIDRFAASGMRFTQAYSASTVCSPTRAALLTGKHPARLHITDWIPGFNFPWAKLKSPEWSRHLPLEERTIAEALKPAGYAAVSIGKWHLTTPDGDPKFLADKQGFDRNLGGTFRGGPPSYFSPYKLETLTDGPAGEYLTDREADETSRFIQENKDRPFLLYLPHHAVHTPLQAKAEKIAKYKALADAQAPQRNPVYAAMIESLDESIGRLMESLETAGVADRTVVLLTGDNGGWIPSTNTNLGLRAGKGTGYEGGVRVPFIVRWPGVTRAGTTCATPVFSCDIYPTLLEAARLKPASGQILDGVSLLPLLKQARRSNGWKRDTLFWHYPHYHTGGATPHSAIRQGDWKLLEYHEDMRVELYNLVVDPEEKTDLAGKEHSRAEKMRKRLHDWRRDAGAQMPTPNPNYDPARATERGR